ncbi:MAG TPA: hypothetical protein VJJ73_01390 [Candidatus Paceibacterota bacterium]
MALSDKEILKHKKLGNIVIEPYRREHLATSSYDVTLGEYYFREQPPQGYFNIYDIYSKKHTDKVWGTKPSRAEMAGDILKDFKLDGVFPRDKVIVIKPGETVLAHTNEFIGGRNIVTTMMKARSSLGRNFIEICKCAGWGDVGYINRWTMEITNNSTHYTIPLVVGMRVAQIIFFETGEILDKSKDYVSRGKYQTTQNLGQLKKNWNPLSMLPKLYKDRRKKIS